MNSFNYALSLWGCSPIQDITNKIQSFNDQNSPQGKPETVMFSDLSCGKGKRKSHRERYAVRDDVAAGGGLGPPGYE